MKMITGYCIIGACLRNITIASRNDKPELIVQAPVENDSKH